MTLEPEQTTPNVLKERDPDLFEEVEEFRARLEEILLDKLENVHNSPAFRDRGNFLPRDDLQAIAHVIKLLTKDSLSEKDLDQFDASWRSAMQSGFFAEAFEPIRFRVKNAVETARNVLAEKRGVADVTQGTLW